MSDSWKVFRAGTRNSPLARLQTAYALQRLARILPGAVFETVEIETPGDFDRATDLRDSPPDFFTRTLDAALLEGRIDLAVHSAKDVPEPCPAGIDWFWWPEAGDRRDALVGSLSPRVVGVSSDRRAAYAARRFPEAVHKPVRGNIEERLRQLDAGRFDLLVMAGVALQRLELTARITEWIPLSELDTPEGQGALAITFRRDDRRMTALRKLFVKTAVIAGAGGGEGHLVLDAMRALGHADICLYDALLDPSVLDHLPENAQRRYVGKRQGRHHHPQDDINRMLCDAVRKGYRTVRLKGGDPGIFGRLAEEINALTALDLPCRIIPGISAMQAAGPGTGIILTRRGTARGFNVMTPRCRGGSTGPVNAAARAALPTVFYMAIQRADDIADELMGDGMAPDTPCALVFSAGMDDEAVYRTSLERLTGTLATVPGRIRSRPGLLFTGEIARQGTPASRGAFGGRRILLTCSAELMERAALAVYDGDGRPVKRPMIRLKILPESGETVRDLTGFDWIALTSPAAVRCFHELALREGVDWRSLPRVMVTGPGTARALRRFGIGVDLMPDNDFSTDGLCTTAADHVAGRRVVRFRSARAGTALSDGLRAAGAAVVDCVLYENRPIRYSDPPEFDAVFFASASAADAFLEQWTAEPLRGKLVLAMGGPTSEALRTNGVPVDLTGEAATVEDTLSRFAAYCFLKDHSCFHNLEP